MIAIMATADTYSNHYLMSVHYHNYYNNNNQNILLAMPRLDDSSSQQNQGRCQEKFAACQLTCLQPPRQPLKINISET